MGLLAAIICFALAGVLVFAERWREVDAEVGEATEQALAIHDTQFPPSYWP